MAPTRSSVPWPSVRPALELLRRVRVVVHRAVGPRAEVAGAGRDHALLERRHRGHRLERRADGLGLRDGTVDHRVVGALPGQLLVVLGADPADPDAGVVGRVARHAEDLAVLHVEDDGRAAVGRVLAVAVRQRDARPQRLLGGRLHLGVEGGDEGVARLRHAAAHGLGLLGPAEGVHLDAGDPVTAAQPLVVGVLEAVLADHVAGRVPLVVRVG